MNYSIAMCTYNGEKYLHDQLNSIVFQTAPPSQIVICDDSSKDNTKNVIACFVKTYPKIKWTIKHNTQNIGIVKNFSQALSLCEEEIILLSDQDDVWLLNKASTILRYFSDSNKSIVFTNAIITDEFLNDTGISLFEKIKFTVQIQTKYFTKESGLFLFLSKSFATGATMAIRKQIANDFFPIPNTNYFIHDSWIATLGMCCNNIGYINEPLIKYRQHSNQIIGLIQNRNTLKLSNNNTKKTFQIINEIQNQANKEYFICDFFEKYSSLISKRNSIILSMRKKIFCKILNPNQSFLSRLFIVVVYPLYRLRIPEFSTLRMYIGNSYYYIFNR